MALNLHTNNEHDVGVSNTDIAAVIITYHPDLTEILKNVAAVVTQVSIVIIVDNSDTITLTPQMFDNERVHLIPNGGNMGIAHALNSGVREAEKLGHTWVLTMDQDSLLPTSYVDGLLTRINADGNKEKIASVAGAFLDFDGTLNTVPSLGLHEVPYLITSANLVRISALNDVSGFRDEFFIDYVDYDISFKLRRAGWRVLQYPDVIFDHRIGESRRRSMSGLNFRVSNHSALRRYYIARNRIVFAKENFPTNPKFAVMDIFRLLKDQVKIGLAEEKKVAKSKAFYYGLLDALTGKLGKTSRKF